MITVKHINLLIDSISGLSDDKKIFLDEILDKYPYCSLFQYLSNRKNTIRQSFLQELYPVNEVMLHYFNDGYDKVDEDVPTYDSPQEISKEDEKPAFTPASADDYFLQQGVPISNELPELEDIKEIRLDKQSENIISEDEQSLLVMMSFSEWLHYLNHKTRMAKEEEEEQKALKTLWRKQKLAAAIEEENEDIPDQVFEMAVNSISPQENMVSEALADVYAMQGKKEKAMDMYRKLSLLNPEKSVYFGHKIENLQKGI